MASGRLAVILEQEYESKGFVSGTISALQKRRKEKTDIRNKLFGGSGITSLIGKKIFGRGYSATAKGSSSSKVSDASSSMSGTLSSESISSLQNIEIASRINAKNSTVLPSLARDMFLVKENIIKLVKASGQKPRTNADMFFSRQMARESAYESKFENKSSRQSTSPKSVTPASTGGSGLSFGILGSIVGVLGGILGGLATTFGSIAAVAGTLAATLGTLFAAVSPLIGVFLTIFGVLRNFLGFIFRSPIGKLLGLGAAALGLSSLSESAEAGTTGIPGMEGDTPSSGSFMQGADTAVTYGTAGLATYGVAKFAQRSVGLGKRTSEAILDARTTSIESIKNSKPETKWGRFLKFLEKRAPKLFAKIGLRLAQAGALMAIPIAGWIGSLFSLGFSLVLAYEVYKYWKEFTGSPEEQEGNQNTSPTQVSTGTTGVVTPGASSTAPTQQSAGSQPSGLSPVQAEASDSYNPEIEKILATIRTRESGGNYSVPNPNPNSTASGAYQFIDKTWKNLTKKYGIGTEFNRAKDAPPNIQDEVARRYVMEILKDNNGDVSKVPLVWYTGNAQGRMTPSQIIANRGQTGEAYQKKFMETYAQGGGTSGTALAAASTSRGSVLDSSSRTLASSSTGSGENVVFNDVKFIDSLAKASAGSGGGSLDRAMPYDRDWYMGVVKTQAL
jgi:hypothetical protein